MPQTEHNGALALAIANERGESNYEQLPRG